jgi:hypothetical protein
MLHETYEAPVAYIFLKKPDYPIEADRNYKLQWEAEAALFSSLDEAGCHLIGYRRKKRV